VWQRTVGAGPIVEDGSPAASIERCCTPMPSFENGIDPTHHDPKELPMKISSSLNTIAVAIAAAFTMNVAAAQTGAQKGAASERTTPMAERGMNYSDRERMGSWNSEQERLEQLLKAGSKPSDYRKILAANGYTITAINQDVVDYAEYEVVKGDHSYEVQIDLDKDTGIGGKVEVSSNLWRADATEEAMRSGKAVMASKPLTNGKVYSDRANRQGWGNEKERLEKRLVLGKNVAFYVGELKSLGYQITSTNDRDKDYVEVEIVKGRDSFEVQMDLDKAGMADKIDVTSNMWQTQATEKALSRNR
jgi:uncharacterized protein YmfQ (DUF2313 family)